MADSFIWTPITLIGNVIFIAIYIILINSVLTRRFSLAATIIGCSICWILSMVCSNFVPYASLVGYLSSILTFFVPVLLFRDKWYKSLFVAVMSVVFVTVADLISATLLYTPEMLRTGVGAQTPAMQAAPAPVRPFHLAVCADFEAV